MDCKFRYVYEYEIFCRVLFWHMTLWKSSFILCLCILCSNKMWLLLLSAAQILIFNWLSTVLFQLYINTFQDLWEHVCCSFLWWKNVNMETECFYSWHEGPQSNKITHSPNKYWSFPSCQHLGEQSYSGNRHYLVFWQHHV